MASTSNPTSPKTGGTPVPPLTRANRSCVPSLENARDMSCGVAMLCCALGLATLFSQVSNSKKALTGAWYLLPAIPGGIAFAAAAISAAIPRCCKTMGSRETTVIE